MNKLTTSKLRVAVSALALTAAATSSVFAQDTKTITIATHYNDEQIAPITACFEAYEAEHPGIDIVHQQASYGDFLQTILTSRVGGTSPDIYNIYSIWAPQLAAAGALEVPPQEVLDFVNANYADGSVGAATIDGQLWGIPTELSVYMLTYNKKLLAEAGYDAPPATWDELLEIAAAISKRNDQGNLTQAGYVYGTTVANATHPFYSQMYSEGVSPFNEDYSATNFTSPEAVAILEGQRALFEQGITGPEMTTDDFPSGTVGMYIAANWLKSTYQDAFGDEFEETVGIAPIPSSRDDWGTMLYSFLWAVDSTSDVKAESWELLQWLNTPQDGLSCTGQMLNGMGALSGNIADLGMMDVDDEFSQAYVEAIESGAAQTQPNVPQAAEIDRVLRSYIEQVWAGNFSAADALAEADAEIQAILDDAAM